MCASQQTTTSPSPEWTNGWNHHNHHFHIIVTFHAGKMVVIVIIFIVTYLESLDGHHYHNFHVIVKIVIIFITMYISRCQRSCLAYPPNCPADKCKVFLPPPPEKSDLSNFEIFSVFHTVRQLVGLRRKKEPMYFATGCNHYYL